MAMRGCVLRVGVRRAYLLYSMLPFTLFTPTKLPHIAKALMTFPNSWLRIIHAMRDFIYMISASGNNPELEFIKCVISP